MEVEGLRGDDVHLPHLLGHEGVGIVLGIGAGVRKVKVGDKVIIGWIKSSGASSKTPTFFDDNNSQVNAGLTTTFSELSVVSENRVYLQPEFLPDKVAVLFGCSMLTGFGMVLNELTPRQKQTILVLGLGGVGISALLANIMINPNMIIAADISEEKRNRAKDLGIKHVLDSSSSDFVHEVLDLTNGGVDIGYECAGYSESIEQAFACLKAQRGHLVFASHPKFGDKIQIDPYELIRGKTITGTWGGRAKPDRDIPKIAKLILNSYINLENLIGNEYPLEQINAAIIELADGNSTRPIIKM
jgi:S-(hydroxymethyl)glutathione dehydrogenase/alcohol dehydrogenase